MMAQTRLAMLAAGTALIGVGFIAVGVMLYARKLARDAPRGGPSIDPGPDMRMDAPPPSSGPPSQRFA